MVPLFKSKARPIVKYANAVWIHSKPIKGFKEKDLQRKIGNSEAAYPIF